MTTNRVSWYTEWLQAGLETKILTEADILAHATPAVLIAALPRDILASVLGGAMSSGTSSPAEVVRIVQPARLAEHVPAAILWPCLAAAAERAGISAARPATDEAAARELLRRVLAAGLAQAQLTASDVVRHVDASVLAHALPDALAQKLLETCLASGKVTPELIVETLGVDGIAAHAPLHVVWACLAAAADPAAAKSSAAIKKQTLEPIDDDVASVLVDLDDSGVLKPMIVESKDAAKPSKNVVRRS
jgi:hypothetical protein